MKGLKEFLEALEDDQSLMAELEDIQNDAAKVVEIAQKHGYEFTEDEFNDFLMESVSGGGKIGKWFKKQYNKVKDKCEDVIADGVVKFAADNPKTAVWIYKNFIEK